MNRDVARYNWSGLAKRGQRAVEILFGRPEDAERLDGALKARRATSVGISAGPPSTGADLLVMGKVK